MVDRMERSPVTILCPKGHSNPAGSAFCGRCGASIDAVAQAPTPTTGEPTVPTGVVSVTPPSMGAAGSWTASHRVPPEGLDVRPEPSPHTAAATRLPAGTQLQVHEWREAWARVTIPSGWGGWVDGRRLVDVNAPIPAQPHHPQAWSQPASGFAAPGYATAPATSTGPGPALVMLGGAAGIGSTFLPWLDFAGVGVNAWDSPFAYLWSTTAGPSGFTVGLAVTILAAIALLIGGFMATSGVVRGATGIVSLAGSLYLAITLAYIFQTVRIALDLSTPFGDILSDWFGIGAWVAFGGAIVITIGSRLRPR